MLRDSRHLCHDEPTRLVIFMSHLPSSMLGACQFTRLLIFAMLPPAAQPHVMAAKPIRVSVKSRIQQICLLLMANFAQLRQAGL